MNKQEIETAIEIIASDKKAFEAVNHGGFTNKIKAFESAISALEHQLTNGWIPVSERLPLQNAYHTIYATLRYKDDGTMFSAKLMWKNGKLEWFNGRQISDKYELMAWQKEYMPEPYKEGKK